MRRSPWLKLVSLSGPLPVYVVRTLSDGSDAWYDPEKNEILVAYAPKRLMKMALFHELKHTAVAPFSGHVKAALWGKRGSRKQEERIVGFSEPLEFELLERNGLLVIPDPPKPPKKGRK